MDLNGDFMGFEWECNGKIALWCHQTWLNFGNLLMKCRFGYGKQIHKLEISVAVFDSRRLIEIIRSKKKNNIDGKKCATSAMG